MNTSLRGYFSGDALDLDRTVPGVPLADPVARARFRIKRRWWDADNLALITKDIDISNTSSGQVTQTGGTGDGDGTALLVFHLLKEETALVLPELLHYYDVRVWLVSGNGFTVEPTGDTRFATALFKRRISEAVT